MLQNPNIIFEGQLEIVIPNTAQEMNFSIKDLLKKSLMENFIFCAWNMQGLRFATGLLLVDFLPIFCSLNNSIMNIISLFGSSSTFAALWESNIPFEIGYIKAWKQTAVTVALLYLRDFFKIWAQSSHRMWKTRLEALSIIFEIPFGIIVPKIQNFYFASQTPITIFHINASFPMP